MLHRPQLTRGLGGRATEKLIFIPRIWACHAHTVAKGTELVVGASGPQARLALLAISPTEHAETRAFQNPISRWRFMMNLPFQPARSASRRVHHGIVRFRGHDHLRPRRA